MKEKIGLFGGSFNPIHGSHIKIAVQAKKQFDLKKVLFIPSARPPHKKDEIVDGEQRAEMVSLAITREKDFSLSRVELEREGISYTVDTLRWFVIQYPQSELYFIIGEDSLWELPSWREPEKFFSMCHFLVAPREWKKEKELTPLKKMGIRFSFIDVEETAVSSTEIRQSIEKGVLPRELPPAVAGYISLYGLYGYPPLLEKGRSLYQKLTKHLSTKKVAHSLSVMLVAVALAKTHGVSIEKAALAGLLHDCAKEMPLFEMQVLLEKEKERYSPQVWSSPSLLHAYAGAKIA
ncbi:MAG: nicotinate (nicotinamide) nucleotide adenylyltransferase, partial [Clostridiales bacterium]|nr:nicotinate (nicotinamide) nucleotide adenylyltransferase [Clostridiales bacterium]